MLNVFAYNIVSTLTLIIMFGILVLPLLLGFFSLEILTSFFVERIMMNKSYSNVIKNEH